MRKTPLTVAVLVMISLASQDGTIAGPATVTGGWSRTQNAPGPASCSAPEYRQFDFWVGSWEVYGPKGNRVGANVIEATLGGCALHENWESASGGRGHSYTFYDARTEQWHQTWVDSSGGTLYLNGAFTDGAMVLSDGTNRITWTPLASGSVRQHWQSTGDGGETWTDVFDGEYRHPGEPESPSAPH